MNKQGLSLDFLDLERKNCERSKNTILAKNLAYSLQEQGLKSLFGRYGYVTRLLLCPNRVNIKIITQIFIFIKNRQLQLSNSKTKATLKTPLKSWRISL